MCFVGGGWIMGNQPSNSSQLHEAIRKGNCKAVRYFISTGKHDLNTKVKKNVHFVSQTWSSLHVNICSVRCTSRSLQINEQTALFVAVLTEKPEIVGLLLDQPEIQTDTLCAIARRDGIQFQWSAIHEACRCVLCAEQRIMN